LQIGLRQANNQLCVLLGIPPTELAAKLGKAPIPNSPPEVVVGIPADLIRRRPELRSAERLIAAQNAQIGVADSTFYPAFFISGSIGYEAQNLSQLFTSKSFTGQIGPAFQWDILNYGRILNNVRLQDFKTQELVGVYQQKVLAAAQEVENNLITFLNARDEAAHLELSVKAAKQTVDIALANFKAGTIDYTPVFVAEQFLQQQQNLLAQARGDIALGLIGVYRAIGGGWEFRLTDEAAQIDADTPGGAGRCRASVSPSRESETVSSSAAEEQECGTFACDRAKPSGTALQGRSARTERLRTTLPEK
jgi:outer membrane protein TolC